jgi:D-alanyl-D-alanine dipeptidase
MHSDKPIPAPLPSQKRSARAYPIDNSHPLYNEPWVEARELGLVGVNFYNSAYNPPYNFSISGSIPQLYLRRSVAERLLTVNAALAPQGLELYLLDAWRPLSIQNYFHDEWFPRYLQQQDPSLSGDALWNEVGKYWSRGAPDGKVNPASPPPHYTGAATDLTLRRIGGETLWMGTIFDDLSERANTDYFERHPPGRSFSDAEAQKNRRILYHAMSVAGFVNVWTEWWHFSWGDQRWAQVKEVPAAYYGPINPLG